MRHALVIGAGLVGAAYLINRAANAKAAESIDGETIFDYANPWGKIETMANNYQAYNALKTTNMQAVQAMVMRAEGTANQPDPFRVCYGYKHTIFNLTEHPAVSGEWKGEKLSATQCKGAGFGPGCVSTAAGAFQINKPTWLEAKRALSLPDFTEASQRKAFAWIVGQQGATSAVERGDIQSVIKLIAKRWASLAGAGYAGQQERSLGTLIAYYQDAGGAMA